MGKKFISYLAGYPDACVGVVYFWLPKMDKSDSPPPNSAWFVLCLVQLLGKYDQRLNDLIDEKRDEMIKETTKLTLVKGGGVNEHTT